MLFGQFPNLENKTTAVSFRADSEQQTSLISLTHIVFAFFSPKKCAPGFIALDKLYFYHPSINMVLSSLSTCFTVIFVST